MLRRLCLHHALSSLKLTTLPSQRRSSPPPRHINAQDLDYWSFRHDSSEQSAAATTGTQAMTPRPVRIPRRQACQHGAVGAGVYAAGSGLHLRTLTRSVETRSLCWTDAASIRQRRNPYKCVRARLSDHIGRSSRTILFPKEKCHHQHVQCTWSQRQTTRSSNHRRTGQSPLP